MPRSTQSFTPTTFLIAGETETGSPRTVLVDGDGRIQTSGGGGGGGGDASAANQMEQIALAEKAAIQPTIGGHISAVTQSSGTNYTSFPDTPCSQLVIVNDSGTDIVVQQGGSGVTITVWDRTFQTFFVTNANLLAVRRKDMVGTPAFVSARWES